MHLFSGLVPMRHMVGGIGEAHVPMTEGAAQHAHVGVRPQGASEQPGGRHALPPLAIEPDPFPACRSRARLRSDQVRARCPYVSDALLLALGVIRRASGLAWLRLKSPHAGHPYCTAPPGKPGWPWACGALRRGCAARVGTRNAFCFAYPSTGRLHSPAPGGCSAPGAGPSASWPHGWRSRAPARGDGQRSGCAATRASTSLSNSPVRCEGLDNDCETPAQHTLPICSRETRAGGW